MRGHEGLIDDKLRSEGSTLNGARGLLRNTEIRSQNLLRDALLMKTDSSFHRRT